ncbi:MAG: type II toxin-antitoxin system Phd/YefM family antitoxin [Spirochaetes bacterium]|nr:type II toxin-antitoxin system Phd/YefM family antitoxin [Spirochaetota bacterium]
MNYLKFTEFRNKSKEYFDQVEHGSSFIITRKGKPVARLVPFGNVEQGWKRENRKITLKTKKATLDFINAERGER